MRVLIYEDYFAERFAPVALMRPVFELICGRECLRRRIARWFPTAEFGVWVRPWLAELYAEEHPDVRVNDIAWIRGGDVLFVNGRWLPNTRLVLDQRTLHQAGFVNGVPVWVLLSETETSQLTEASLLSDVWQLGTTRRIVAESGQLLEYPWNLIGANRDQLIRDFEDEGVSQNSEAPHVQILGDSRDLYVSQRATLDPYVVIDTRSGPVSIDRDAKIQSFTRIEGPCHIGRDAHVFRALIRGGTTIGEHCRVGGEIEESILHACVNKYHEGFLGHSYVCPWVNLGAMTCTSDLKNDYSTVRVPMNGSLVDTGLSKVGSFIGDHTKAALDSMFNTGSSIGIMSMVLTGGRLLPRNVPSFASVMYGELGTHWSLDSSIETARVVMQRRGFALTAAAEKLLRFLYTTTESERTSAIQRAALQAAERQKTSG